jgi:uncharacterized protein YodC (DUF2158 family)
MERFQIGDTVRFKSGGPWMTITALGVYSGWTMRCADTVVCRWLEGEKLQETVLDMALLERVPARGALQRDRRPWPLDRLHEKKPGFPSHTH